MTRKNTVHLTKTSVESLPVPDCGRVRYPDDTTPGLVLVVSHTGRKVFVLVKKAQGRTHNITLGVFGEMTVSEARLVANSHAVRLARGEATHKRQQVPKFDDVFKLFIDDYAKQHKRTWQEDVLNYDRYLRKVIGNRRIDQITRRDVAGIHSEITKRGPYQANRILALMSAVFNYVIDRLEIDIRNPCKGVKKNRERSRDRFLKPEEMRRFIDTLHDPLTPTLWRDFFMLALLTGARRSNVQSMAWDDIDLDAGLWRIPAEQTKGGENVDVVLVPQAVEILRQRKHTAGASPYVFPSPRKQSQHVSEPKETWKRILQRAGINDFRIHDLRRTFGSWQAALGSSLLVIGKSLGQRSTSATAIYSRMNLDPVRESAEKAVSAMLSSGKPAAEPGPEA